MIAAIVLAAGMSQRMGKPKLLLKLNDDTIIEHIIKELQQSNIDSIVVVLGHNPQSLIELLSKYSVRTVINKNYKDGMTSSFKVGLNEVKNTADAALLVLGDQPFISHTLINKLIDTYKKTPETKIVSPIYKGKKGHPVLFDKSLFEEILSLPLDKYIRDVIHNHYNEIVTIPWDKGTILDIDTPEDYIEALKYFKSQKKNE